MEKEIVLGIDLGGTYTKLGLITKSGVILKSLTFDTNANLPFEDFLKRLEIQVDLLKSDLGPNMIVGIGIGAPNANPYSGNMENPPNFRWGNNVPLATAIEEILQHTPVLANDANAAALSVLDFGIGKSMKNFVVLTLGTGLGSGIISSGVLLIGAHGMAGEIGHVNVNGQPNARQCNCGLTGCLETYVSVTGIRRTIFELIAEMTEDSVLRSIGFNDMTGEMISDAALDGDAIALRAFKMTGEILGVQMADTAAHLDPEAFILLGGLSKAGGILLKPTIAAMEANLFTAYKGKIKVMVSNTPGENTVLGPAALAWRNYDKR